MYVHIDYNSGEPISRQVVSQIKWMIVSGVLGPGEKLPSIRELAKQLKINPTTVTRIYGELAHQGIIALRQGQGAFVSQQVPTVAPGEVRRIVADKAREMLVEGMRLGLDRAAIDEIVDDEFRKIRTPEHE